MTRAGSVRVVSTARVEQPPEVPMQDRVVRGVHRWVGRFWAGPSASFFTEPPPYLARQSRSSSGAAPLKRLGPRGDLTRSFEVQSLLVPLRNATLRRVPPL